MSTLHEAHVPHESRYHVTKPPENLHAILRKLAKATRDPVYRRHGCFHKGDAIRSEILSVADVRPGDADDIVRFLKKNGVLKADRDENDPGVKWQFDAAAADMLYAKCVAAGTVKPNDRSIVSYCVERISDPGPVPTNGHAVSEPEEPKRDFTEYNDELLAELASDLKSKIAPLQDELDAVAEEQRRRAERKLAEAELEKLAATEAELKRQLQELAKRKLDLAARASGKVSG